MSVFVLVCMGIYMYAYMYVKENVGAYRCNMCAYKCMYTYLGLYVCVYVCTSTHIYMKRRRVCIQSVCIQTQAYISVFVSCYRFFLYIFTYMCTKSTCVCAYVYIYTHVCVNAYIHVCFCTCVCGYIYVR